MNTFQRTFQHLLSSNDILDEQHYIPPPPPLQPAPEIQLAPPPIPPISPPQPPITPAVPISPEPTTNSI